MVLHDGYNQVQLLEPDLVQAQADITWAEHLAFVYPIWWGGIPALMKGFFDRIFLPGFAFKYREGKAFPDKLLKGKTAHLLVTMDTPPWYYKWVCRMPGLQRRRLPAMLASPQLCAPRQKTGADGPDRGIAEGIRRAGGVRNEPQGRPASMPV